MLSEKNLRGFGYFNSDKVARLRAKCNKQDGQLISERENMAVVGILSTQLLHHHFIENFPAFLINERKDVRVYR
jgi:asparagine synthase (glutamine-hydrolysing)